MATVSERGPVHDVAWRVYAIRRIAEKVRSGSGDQVRDALRDVVGRIMPFMGDVRPAMRASPIIHDPERGATPSDKVAVRFSQAGLRDALSTAALFQLAAYYTGLPGRSGGRAGASWGMVLDAIVEPDVHGFLYGRKTKTGFSLGARAGGGDPETLGKMFREHNGAACAIQGELPAYIYSYAKDEEDMEKMLNTVDYNTLVTLIDAAMYRRHSGGSDPNKGERKATFEKMVSMVEGHGFESDKAAALLTMLLAREDSGNGKRYFEPMPSIPLLDTIREPGNKNLNDIYEKLVKIANGETVEATAASEESGIETEGGEAEAKEGGEAEGEAEAEPEYHFEAKVKADDMAELEDADLLDTILGKVSGGKMPTFNDIVRERNEFRREAIRLAEEANDAVARMRRNRVEVVEPTVSSAHPRPKKGGLPNGTVRSVLAAKAFSGKKPLTGTVAKMLDFDVPMFSWDDHHPYVPAVDPNYVFQPRQLMKVLVALNADQKAWLYGHTGCGKTSLVEQVCARLNWPFVRVNLDSEISRLDLIGRETLTVEEGVTKSLFVDGVLPQAMQMGAVLCFDEMDFIRPDVSYVINRTLEGNGLMIAEDGGREVVPAKHFRIVATANTKGHGDEYGIYAGARVQSAAVLDRFSPFIECNYLPAAPEVSLVGKKSGLDKDTCEKLVNLAKEIRTAFAKGEIMQTFSPRGLISAAKSFVLMRKLMSDEDKAREMVLSMAILDKASDSDRPRIMEIAQRIFPS